MDSFLRYHLTRFRPLGEVSASYSRQTLIIWVHLKIERMQVCVCVFKRSIASKKNGALFSSNRLSEIAALFRLKKQAVVFILSAFFF